MARNADRSGPEGSSGVSGSVGGAQIGPAEAQAALRVGISIVMALLLGAPGLISAAQGQRDFVSAAWWFLLSFIASRLAVGVLFSLWRSYRVSIDQARSDAERKSLTLELDRRRAELTHRSDEVGGVEMPG